MINRNLFKKEFFLVQLPSALFILIPLLLITGPLLSDLAVTFISILFIIQIIINKNYIIFKNNYFRLFLVFWIYIILNSLLQNINFDSLKISLSYFRFGFFIFAVAYLLEKNQNNIKYFFYCLIFCYIILIFDGLIQYIYGKNIIGYELQMGPRVSSFFGDDLILGSYLSRLFPLLFGLYIFLDVYKKFKFLNILILFIFIFTEVLIFLSGERTAFFFINLTAIFMILFLKNYKKLRITTLILSLLAIFLITLINPLSSKRIITQTLEEMNIGSLFLSDEERIEKKVIFTEQHTDHYLTSINILKDNYVFGVGVKNFRKFCKNEKYRISVISCSTHPHNTYIQLLAETGIFGFMFLFSLLLIFCYYIFNHAKGLLENKSLFSDFQICLLSSVLITLWPISPSGNFFNNWLSVIYYLPLGFFLFSITEEIDIK